MLPTSKNLNFLLLTYFYFIVAIWTLVFTQQTWIIHYFTFGLLTSLLRSHISHLLFNLLVWLYFFFFSFFSVEIFIFIPYRAFHFIILPIVIALKVQLLSSCHWYHNHNKCSDFQVILSKIKWVTTDESILNVNIGSIMGFLLLIMILTSNQSV